MNLAACRLTWWQNRMGIWARLFHARTKPDHPKCGTPLSKAGSEAAPPQFKIKRVFFEMP